MKRLAIITTHPIQYNAPLFHLLNERGKIQIKVFYTWGHSAQADLYDPGFGIERKWDIPLLVGYDHEFIVNTSRHPGTHHFMGIVNPGLRKKIKAFHPDAILVYGWSFYSHLKVLRQFKGRVPVFFRGDSTLLGEPAGFALKKMMRRLFLKWVYLYVDLAFYTGTNNKEYFRKHGLKEDQLFFAPHATDNGRFFDKDGDYEEKALAWRRKLNIRDEDTVFLFAGKLEPIKNINLLISSFLMIQPDLNKEVGTQLVIVGNGILEKDLKEKYAGKPNLHFIDFQNQSLMPVVYRLGNVFVLPSVSETWGLSINEAMASERAILLSDTCGSAIDLVKDSENGYIFNSGNSKDLAEKMILMARDKNRLRQMGLQSASKIVNWNFEQVAAVIENKITGR